MIMVELMIDQYFHAGFKYEEIVVRFHGVEVSFCTLH